MRQLLALFALLSGLAAIGAPDTARAGAIEDALTELAEQAAQVDCEATRTGAVEVCKPAGKAQQKRAPRQKRNITITVPAFQLKADRALE